MQIRVLGIKLLALIALSPVAFARDDDEYLGPACLLFSESWSPLGDIQETLETLRVSLDLQIVMGVRSGTLAGCSEFIAISQDRGQPTPAIGMTDVAFARQFPAANNRHSVQFWQTLGATPNMLAVEVDYTGGNLRTFDDQGNDARELVEPYFETSDMAVVSNRNGSRYIRITSFGGDVEHLSAMLTLARAK